jgi:hypothetical protein
MGYFTILFKVLSSDTKSQAALDSSQDTNNSQDVEFQRLAINNCELKANLVEADTEQYQDYTHNRMHNNGHHEAPQIDMHNHKNPTQVPTMNDLLEMHDVSEKDHSGYHH